MLRLLLIAAAADALDLGGRLQATPSEDLGQLVPELQNGDRAAFKATLGVMVKNGGNERIKRSLQGTKEDQRSF